MDIYFLLLIFITFAETSPVREKNPEEAGYFEGDILMRRATIRGGNWPEDPGNIEGDIFTSEGLETRSAIRGGNWPNGIIPIAVDKRFRNQERQILRSAMQEISTRTCIRFVTRTTEGNYVFINRGRPNSGCFSHLGRIGGRQIINIEPSFPFSSGTCVQKGTIEHELVHTIGFVHEQSRTDRDNFVTINFSNIPNDVADNFRKYSSIQLNNQGLPYDYSSLMHYPAYAFAINPKIPTIITPRGINIGQRNGLSVKDVQKIRRFYKC